MPTEAQPSSPVASTGQRRRAIKPQWALILCGVASSWRVVLQQFRTNNPTSSFVGAGFTDVAATAARPAATGTLKQSSDVYSNKNLTLLEQHALHDWIERYKPRTIQRGNQHASSFHIRLDQHWNAPDASICDQPPGHGMETPDGWDLLYNKMRRYHHHDDSSANSTDINSTTTTSNSLSLPRILCVVHHQENDEMHAKTFEDAVLETWGWRCDGFVTVASVTTTSGSDYVTAGLDYLQSWVMTTTSTTNAQPSPSALKFVAEHYLEQYDYFLVVPLDALVVLDHLRQFLTVKLEGTIGRNTVPIYAGQVPPEDDDSHDSGYIINRLALEKLASQQSSSPSYCAVRPFRSCLDDLQIQVHDSSDRFQRHRFHKFPIPILSQQSSPPHIQQTLAEAWHERSSSLANISPTAIVLDGIPHATLLRRLAAIVYRSCPAGTALADALSPLNATSLYMEEVDNLVHPHGGARTSSGILGLVADVTRVRRHFLEQFEKHHKANHSRAETYLPISQSEWSYVCDPPGGQGNEQAEGWDVVTNRVHVNGLSPNSTNAFPPIQPKPNATAASQLAPAKILCAVYTHAGDHHLTQTVSDIWGWRCDGFFAASTKTVDDPNELGYGAIDLPHYGPEQYENMWQKTRSILGYMYDNYMDEYDYFYVAGNDVLLIMDNLRYYIAELEGHHGREEVPVYTGLIVRSLTGGGGFFDFALGGPGYIMNRLALRTFIEQASECHRWSQVASEDRFVGKCLFIAGVKLIDSANNATHQQRFFDLNPAWVVQFKPEQNPFLKVAYDAWANDYGHGWKIGLDLISEQTAVFHRVNIVLLKRLAAILYKSCPAGSILGDQLGVY